VAGHTPAPLTRKLGIGPGARLSLDAAPPGWRVTGLPEGVVCVPPPARVDVLIAFFRTAAELPGRLPPLAERVFPAGSLWIAWPRRAGGHRSDITERSVRDHALALGIVDTKVAALDDDWSGLRFVWRLENR
jgi:hypothetical protein